MPFTALPRLVRAWLLFSLLSCLPSLALAQCINLTTVGSAVTQNFDTLSNTAGSTTNNLTIPGWFLTETGGGARDNEQYAVDTGAAATGDMVSFGAAAATDRALGGLRSGTLIPTFGACFTNNTGATLASLAVAYTGEEWRLGTAARTDQITFEYSTTATDLVTGTWTGVTALNFVTPDTATVGAKNGNAAADRTALASTITGLSIANGATFWIRWNDVDASGADDGLAVDDFSLTPQAPIALPNLSVNDVSLNEGNAGTTSFTFTVSLSAPAGPGGVTFDIASADGSAIAPSDYTAKSLSSQTIPAGSSTYSFTVLVKGDSVREANETFLVTVSAVTGATVSDGQGQATIVNDDPVPTLSIDDVSLAEGNVGTTTFSFTVSLSAPAPAGGVTFDIATADGTAVAPGDYTAKSLTAQTIPAGSDTYTFDVLVNRDNILESNESFVVNLANAANATLADAQGVGTIVNDDAAPNLSIDDASINEGNTGTTTFTFTVSLSTPAPAGGVTFDIATADGTAVAPGDYTAKSLTAQTIPAGSSSYTFAVLVNGDNVLESNESFVVNLANVTNALLADAQGVGIIVNDDVAPNLSIDDVSVNEGNTGTTTFSFTASLSAPAPAGGVTFDIATADGTAIAPGDYTAKSLSGQTIPAGSSSYTFNVLVNGDNVLESNESFVVNLTNAANATLTDAQGVGTIVNDDVAPNLSIDDVSLNEGNAGTTTFSFTASLSAPAPAGGVTFDIATANGTAVAPGDYTAKSLTAQTIPAGSSSYTFDVLVNGDTTPEGDETFFVNITNASNATVSDGQAQGTLVNEDVAPNFSIDDVTLAEGSAGTTTYTFTASLSAPAPTGGVTFDIATANGTAVAPGDYTAKSLTGQTIPTGASSYTFAVLVNGDTTPESDETFFVNITNATNAVITDGQGQGSIVNDDATRIHDVQGNGAATPIPGATVTVQGVVIGAFQGTGKLQGFFLQETDADADADPATSEGIFVFCNTCPTPVAEGQIVRATGIVAENNNQTRISATTAAAVVVTNAGNNLAQVTPTTIDLPVVGPVDDFYETRESMRVTFVDTLTVSDYFEMARYGQLVLMEGGRPRAFTEFATPNVAGYADYLDNLARRRVLLDDDSNAQQAFLAQPNGMQSVYHPRANGGFSVGTQGTDFFRGGDRVNGLTGVLDFTDPAGATSPSWRVRPVAATPPTFTVANPRPATPPVVGGAIKVTGLNLLNYFTTIDTTASNSSGPCGPGGTLDCRGADSVAELNRQRERASVVICSLDADIAALMELENTTPSVTITDLLGAINTRCGGAHPYAFVNTGGTLGTDAIRVQQIYRTGVVSPVGAPLSDLDPVHNRPPTAQTFDVVDAANAAFGQRFTVIANHLRAKSCSGASGGDADSGDGQSCFTATRTAQASRLLSWINSTVIPAAGDPDVLLLGDFNAYAQETPIATIVAGGYTDLETAFEGPATYSYVFGGALGHLDYAFASASLNSQVIGASAWHINADEVPLLDYSDEVADVGESAFEEKPDGSALVPPRVVFQPATPYRASDHDPVLVGLFAISDLAVTLTDSPDPVVAGSNLTYTISVSNNGPDAATTASWNILLPPGRSFVSLPAVAGWSCTTPAVGAGGTISCSNPNFAVGGSVFTLTAAVNASLTAGTVLSATATVTSTSGDPTPGNNSATATTTVAASADLSVTNTAAPATAISGQTITYTLTASNAGPSDAASVSLSNPIPANTTFTSLASPGGWSCTTPAVGATGTVSCTATSLALTSAVFTLVVTVDAGATAANIVDTASVSAATGDPNPGNESATATTPLSAEADLRVTNTAAPATAVAGQALTYTMTVTNTGPSTATLVSLSNNLPPGSFFTSLNAPAGWICTTPAVGAIGMVTCSTPSLAVGSAVFSLVVMIDPNDTGASVVNTATATSPTPDPVPNNEAQTASTPLQASADLGISNTASTPTAINGQPITYTVTLTNNGPSAAATAAMNNPIPANTSFTAATTPPGWSCSLPTVGGTGTVGCVINSLPPGSTVFSITVTVNPGAPVTMIVDTATATSTTSDPVPGNASATATTSTPVSLQSFEVD